MNRGKMRAIAQAAVMAAGLLHASGLAAPITWVGANNDWLNVPANGGNWTPATEPGSDDTAVFNASNSVKLGSNNAVSGVVMSGGIDLDLNGFTLLVDGLVQLSGNSTNLFVGGATALLYADNITINSGATLELNGGTVVVNEDELLANGVLAVNSGASLVGNGTLTLADVPLLAGTLLNNNGTLSALSRQSNVLLPPPVGTLTIGGGGATGRIDLDGSGETGVVNVNRNQTLDINVQLADTFNGTMNLSQNSTIDINSAWSLGAGGAIVVDNGAIGGFPGVPAGKSTIAGATLTQSGGNITVTDTDGVLQFDAPLAMTGGTLTNNGLVVFAANATIGAGAVLAMPTASSSLTVNPGVTVTINHGGFDADGLGQSTNVLTVNSGGVMVLNLGAAADQSLSGTIRLGGGGLHVTTNDDDWAIDGSVQVLADTGISQLSGEALTLTNAATSIGGNSTLRIAAPLTLASGNTFSGTGVLAFNNTVTVASATTINMVGGTVDLDGTDAVGDILNVRANLTINAASLSDFGRSNVGGGVNVIQIDALSPGATGALTVNLDDPDAEWTLNPHGSLVFLNTNALVTMLAGADVNLHGSVSVTGSAGAAARFDLTGVMNLLTASPNGGLLLQGGTLADPNRIENGLINGPGELRATSNRALAGYGTISAPIDFDGTAQLVASGGLLDVQGAILDVAVLRVEGPNASLNLGLPLNTSVTDGGIVLNGGTLQGATLTTASAVQSIRGIGTVHNAVINNGALIANGGTLAFTNTPSDWDGAAGTGMLGAMAGGTIQIIDNSHVTFGGSVQADAGSTISFDGFDSTFAAGSTINLTGAKFVSTNTTHIDGAVIIGSGTESTMQVQVNRFLEFRDSSSTTLNGNLRLVTNNGNVDAGATFTGNGALIVNPGSNLLPDPGANINVLVLNEGRFYVSGFFVGRNDVRDFQQLGTGALLVDLAGSSLNEFDRLVVNGAMQLDGALELGLQDGYVPASLVPHTILTGLSRTGTFDTIAGMVLSPTKYLAVTYTPTAVLVTATVPGDADLDGDVDVADLGILASNWQTSGTWVNADFNGSGFVDVADLGLLASNWQAGVAGSSPTAGPWAFAEALSSFGLAAPAVPEPGLLGFGALALLNQRRRRRRSS